MIEVQRKSVYSGDWVPIYESIELTQAQHYYHEYRKDYPDVGLRMIEILREATN